MAAFERATDQGKSCGNDVNLAKFIMRRVFVLRLGPETKPEQRLFEGHIEEVDSFLELRFHSIDELLTFLAERLEAADRAKEGEGEI